METGQGTAFSFEAFVVYGEAAGPVQQVSVPNPPAEHLAPALPALILSWRTAVRASLLLSAFSLALTLEKQCLN